MKHWKLYVVVIGWSELCYWLGYHMGGAVGGGAGIVLIVCGLLVLLETEVKNMALEIKELSDGIEWQKKLGEKPE